MSFWTKIESYSGVDATASVAATKAQLLAQGVKTVVNKLCAINPPLAYQFSDVDIYATSSVAISDFPGKILSATRGGKPCTLLVGRELELAKISTSIYNCTAYSPGYYFEAEMVKVLPALSGSASFQIQYVTYGTVNDTSETIAFFPIEYHPLFIYEVALDVLLIRIRTAIGTLTTLANTAGSLTLTTLFASFDTAMTAEDTELAGAFIGAIQQKIQEYLANGQNVTNLSQQLIANIQEVTAQLGWLGQQAGYVKSKLDEQYMLYSTVKTEQK